MTDDDAELVVYSHLKTIPDVSVSQAQRMVGFVMCDFLLGSRDDYPNGETMASSSVSFVPRDADGDQCMRPNRPDHLEISELNIHLPSEPSETEAVDIARQAVGEYEGEVRITTRSLSDGTSAPHIQHRDDADFGIDTVRSMICEIVQNHPAFEWDSSEAEDPVTFDDLDLVEDMAEEFN